MPNALKKIGEDEYRFDCDCGRIHLISKEDDGKIKIETIYKKPKGDDDDSTGKAGAGDSGKKAGTGKERKGIFDGIL